MNFAIIHYIRTCIRILVISVSAATTAAYYDTAQDDINLQQNPAYETVLNDGDHWILRKHPEYETVPPLKPVATATHVTAQQDPDDVHIQQNPAYETVLNGGDHWILHKHPEYENVPPLKPVATVHQE